MSKAEPKGEWKHKVVAEVAVKNTTTVWKTQKSIAPDGKKFVGIRKFITKKDGTQQVTSTGISFPYGEHQNEVQIVMDLLERFL